MKGTNDHSLGLGVEHHGFRDEDGLGSGGNRGLGLHVDERRGFLILDVGNLGDVLELGFGLVHECDDVLDVLRRGGGRAGDQLLLEGWGRLGPAHDTGADDLDGDAPGPVLGRGVEGQDGVARDGSNLRDDVTTADPSAHVVDGVVAVEADQAAVVAVEPSDRSGGFVQRRA